MCEKSIPLLRIERRIHPLFRPPADSPFEKNSHFYSLFVGETDAFERDVNFRDIPLLIISIALLLILAGLKFYHFRTYYEPLTLIPLAISVAMIIANSCLTTPYIIIAITSGGFLVYHLITRYLRRKPLKPKKIMKKYQK